MWLSQALPRSFLNAPAVFCATSFSPEASATNVFGFKLSAPITSISARNLEIPPTIAPVSSTLNQYVLLPVKTSASATILSMNFLVCVNSSTTTALTVLFLKRIFALLNTK